MIKLSPLRRKDMQTFLEIKQLHRQQTLRSDGGLLVQLGFREPLPVNWREGIRETMQNASEWCARVVGNYPNYQWHDDVQPAHIPMLDLPIKQIQDADQFANAQVVVQHPIDNSLWQVCALHPVAASGPEALLFAFHPVLDNWQGALAFVSAASQAKRLDLKARHYCPGDSAVYLRQARAYWQDSHCRWLYADRVAIHDRRNQQQQLVAACDDLPISDSFAFQAYLVKNVLPLLQKQLPASMQSDYFSVVIEDLALQDRLPCLIHQDDSEQAIAETIQAKQAQYVAPPEDFSDDYVEKVLSYQQILSGKAFAYNFQLTYLGDMAQYVDPDRISQIRLLENNLAGEIAIKMLAYYYQNQCYLSLSYCPELLSNQAFHFRGVDVFS